MHPKKMSRLIISMQFMIERRIDSHSNRFKHHLTHIKTYCTSRHNKKMKIGKFLIHFTRARRTKELMVRCTAGECSFFSRKNGFSTLENIFAKKNCCIFASYNCELSKDENRIFHPKTHLLSARLSHPGNLIRFCYIFLKLSRCRLSQSRFLPSFVTTSQQHQQNRHGFFFNLKLFPISLPALLSCHINSYEL